MYVRDRAVARVDGHRVASVCARPVAGRRWA